MTAHEGEFNLLCVSVDTGQATDLPVQNGGYCIFSSLLSLGVAMLLPFKINTSTQQNIHH